MEAESRGSLPSCCYRHVAGGTNNLQVLAVTPGVEYRSRAMQISQTWLEDTVWGGALLGGGGGGSVAEGLSLGRAAFQAGRPALVHPDNHPVDGLLASCSVAEAPVGGKIHVNPGNHMRAVELLREHLSGELSGLIAEGMGGRAVVDGWYQSAVLGFPVVDLPGDGRGHPLPLQGTLGLTTVEGFISWQACAGGDPDHSEYVEMYVAASLPIADKLTRRAAAQAGGAVAVARNPVMLSRVLGGGVPGGIRQAQELGKEYRVQLAASVELAAKWLTDQPGARYWGDAEVTGLQDSYSRGMSIAMIECTPYRLMAVGTFLTLEREGELLASYPDLIIALDALNGMPLTIGELSKGRRFLLLSVPSRSLKLGAGAADPVLMQSLEELTGRPMVP